MRHAAIKLWCRWPQAERLRRAMLSLSALIGREHLEVSRITKWWRSTSISRSVYRNRKPVRCRIQMPLRQNSGCCIASYGLFQATKPRQVGSLVRSLSRHLILLSCQERRMPNCSLLDVDKALLQLLPRNLSKSISGRGSDEHVPCQREKLRAYCFSAWMSHVPTKVCHWHSASRHLGLGTRDSCPRD